MTEARGLTEGGGCGQALDHFLHALQAVSQRLIPPSHGSLDPLPVIDSAYARVRLAQSRARPASPTR